MNIWDDLSQFGHIVELPHSKVLFGNKNLSLSLVEKNLKTPCILKQVHGDKIVEANPKQVAADGHFTTLKSRSMVIKSADCMPVFLDTPGVRVALHIGWRGLAQRILTKAIKQLDLKGSQVHLALGPHIHALSFELDDNCLNQILTPHDLSRSELFRNGWAWASDRQPKHHFISLKKILIREAKACGIEHFHILEVNTFTSAEHRSYRRKKYPRVNNLSILFNK